MGVRRFQIASGAVGTDGSDAGREPQAVSLPGSTVRSARLNPEAQVRNRLFPKTRSWFSLDAPLELLSSLSVLRMLFAFEVVTFPLVAVMLRTSESGWIAVGSVTVSVAISWVALVRVRHVDAVWTRLLFALDIAQVAVLVWEAGDMRLSYAYVLFDVLIGVSAALFLSLRALLVQQGVVAVIAFAAFVGFLGVGGAAAVAGLIGVTGLVASVTVWFLTRTSKRQGSVDPDTGLPNGIGLSRRVGAMLGEESFVVAVARLEGVNDARQALGHEVGTELMRRAVEDLGQVLPPSTFIGRVGGDEIVVVAGLGRVEQSARDPERLVSDEMEAVSSALATTLASAIGAGRYLVGDIELSIRTHIGMAIGSSGRSDVPELVRRASLSAARAAVNRQAHVYWDGETDAMTADDLALLADLRLAGERGELELAYQPQVLSGSKHIAAAEALLRWNSPVYGPVSPARFIPLAERTGLIDRITHWVVSEALDAQVRWRKDGIRLPVSVNLSPSSLTTPELPERILRELAVRGLPSRCLTVEVTETAEIDLLQAVQLLQPLHDEGVRIAIDDFGTGYTSLAILPDLPLDELKVDQRFVLRSLRSAADDAIVQTVVGLAHRLGLDAVAEGVETREHSDRMAAYGFDLLQGYYHSRPLTEPDLVRFALTSHDGVHVADRSDRQSAAR